MFESLKHRIHNFRIPIRNQRVLMLVKTVYFVTPIVLGSWLMQKIIPDPEAMRDKLKPSDHAATLTAEHRRGLQETLAAAEAVSMAKARS